MEQDNQVLKQQRIEEKALKFTTSDNPDDPLPSIKELLGGPEEEVKEIYDPNDFVQAFICGLCSEKKEAAEIILLKKCQHEICKPCAVKSLTLDSYPQIKCPKCTEALLDSEIELVFSKEDMRKAKKLYFGNVLGGKVAVC